MERRFFLPMKYIEKKYAEDMLENGNIRFGCPENWAELGRQGIIGQGDPDEGTFIKMPRNQEKRFESLCRGNIEKKYDSNYFYVRNLDITMQPTYCFFTLLNEHPDYKLEKPGWQKINYTIISKFFFDFVQGKSEEEVKQLPDDMQPALVIIKDAENFKQRIIKALSAMGINKIDFDAVNYYDDNRTFYFCAHFNRSLFYKKKYFDYQNEARFSIPDSKFRLKDISEGLFINIGSIEDIAEISYKFPSEGIEMEMMAKVIFK